MFGAIVGVILFIIGLYLVVSCQKGGGKFDQVTKSVGFNADFAIASAVTFIGFALIASRSFVIIGPDEVGHLKRIYFAKSMEVGQVIAKKGEKGPQAEIVPPGFHVIPFVRVLNEVEALPQVEIPKGSYGQLVARDGEPLREGQFLADKWEEKDFKKMLDAEYFLSKGGGQKGPQLTVLKPGFYRINRYLWQVQNAPALDVPTGSVAVIRSNVKTGMKDGATLKRMAVTTETVVHQAVLDGEGVVLEAESQEDVSNINIMETPITECPDVIESAGGETGKTVAAPLVPHGCIGVWDQPLPPGRYYLNSDAYVPTIIPTRLQTWQYKGGYVPRRINLEVTDEGKIKQHIDDNDNVPLPVPKEAADQAIMVRVEGWTVPVEMRVVVQVHPQDAPFVVASVGDLQKIEDSIVTPTIRDILRTIAGHPERRVLDFIEKREDITGDVEKVVALEAKKAGVTIQEVRMGEPAIPPELLVARLREQLAHQLKETYIQEQMAQKERIAKEAAKATADQQATLVKAEIEKEAAEHQKETLRLEGEGQRLKLEEIAKGQAAQAKVLGQERTMQLQMLKEVLIVARENPDIIKVPMVNVAGNNGLEGSAAVLGSLIGQSNLGGMIGSQSKTNSK